MVENKKSLMEYRYLGNTGLKVSIIGFGNLINGFERHSQEKHDEIVAKILENGVNYFDTAEFYGQDTGENLLGQSFKNLNVNRKDVVVSTKIFFNHHTNVNDQGLSRKKVIESTRNCLKRLQLDYVDIIFGSRPDYETPIEEIVRAFSWLVEKGLAMYWATSEWPVEMISAAV